MHFKQKYSYTADVLLEVDKIKDLQDENSLCKLCVQLFIFFVLYKLQWLKSVLFPVKWLHHSLNTLVYRRYNIRLAVRLCFSLLRRKLTQSFGLLYCFTFLPNCMSSSLDLIYMFLGYCDMTTTKTYLINSLCIWNQITHWFKVAKESWSLSLHIKKRTRCSFLNCVFSAASKPKGRVCKILNGIYIQNMKKIKYNIHNYVVITVKWK